MRPPSHPATLDFALQLAQSMRWQFYDAEAGGFWQSAADTPHLLFRIKDDYDGAEPVGNSVAVRGLLRLAALPGRNDLRHEAEHSLEK